MHDWFNRNGRGKTDGRRVRLEIDSWIDSWFASSWEGFKDRYNAASSYFARFKITGWRRGATELMSETLTLSCGGLLVVYVLAVPALLEFDEAKINAGKFAVKFLDRNGAEIGKRGILFNDAIPLEDIPDHLIKATLATEDRRFFEHFGVDVIGTARALLTNLNAGETVQGGSTLTQQLAKNLFLANERSFDRKIKELFLSFLLESRFSKRDILKMYLDRAYMGGGAVGVEAASQFYFGKSVKDITLAESAVLAGLFKAPTKYAPHANPRASRTRTNDVLSNLVEAGYMTAGQVHQARLNPARVVDNRSATAPDWFLDWAFEEVQRIAEGKGVYTLTARTTIDLSTQQQAEDAVINTIRSLGRNSTARTAALVAMEPAGAVRAIVGGLDYGESQFNRATAARRQPGSSFKLYVYAAALEHGMTNRSVVRDSAPAPCGPRGWQPKNYSGSMGGGGSYTLQDAFKVSLNTVAVDLSLYRLGRDSRDKVLSVVDRLGVQGVRKTCSMALGDTGISLIQHTGAYANFANNGKDARPYAILELFNAKGDLVYSRERDEPPPRQVFTPRVAEQMNQMMQAVVNEGTGKRAALDFTHAIGKTGTSSSYRDAWFMGATGALVTGVWVGNDEFRPIYVAGKGVTGGSIPAQIWHDFMVAAHTNMNIPTLPGLQPHPRQVQEMARIAELKRVDPAAAIAQSAPRSAKIMPDQTRDMLKKIADAMRRVAGATDGASPTAPAGPGADPRRASSVERRVELGAPGQPVRQ
ncbi:MAG: PBP1A family penicillin-binding protein [Hyphomicrobiales bacterium]|nr:PBP1A family penicillin-binding protein [Hyphomicrobiales bacterium]